jgi:hypothetical protein
MGVITGYTAERMLDIEQTTIVDASVVGDNLILEQRSGNTINAGSVKGPQGDPGPLGGIGEAPVDGEAYVRKDADWHLFSPVEEAPLDGKTYARKDQEWVESADRPWKLDFDWNDAQRPPGFLVDSATNTREWYVTFSGSGYVVNYKLLFAILGSDISATARLTLPSNMAPVIASDTNAFVYDYTGAERVGNVAARINADGTVVVPTLRPALLVSLPEDLDGDGKIQKYDSIYTIGIQMSGTFIRNNTTLPSLATYV